MYRQWWGILVEDSKRERGLHLAWPFPGEAAHIFRSVRRRYKLSSNAGEGNVKGQLHGRSFGARPFGGMLHIEAVGTIK
jgi:hypothetical protein